MSPKLQLRQEMLLQVKEAFPELNAAEELLARDFLRLARPQAGEAGNLGTVLTGSAPGPLTQEVVCAALVRFLCTMGGQAEALVPKGMTVEGRKILGELDLSCLKIPFPLVFKSCDLSDGIDLTDSETRCVDFTDCCCTSLTGQRLKVNGQLKLSNLNASGKVNLRCVKVTGDLVLSGANLGLSQFYGDELAGERLETLCRALAQDLELTRYDTSAAWLNKQMENPGLFAQLAGRKGTQRLSAEVTGQLDEQRRLQEQAKTRAGLGKFNRQVLKAFYPRQAPACGTVLDVDRADIGGSVYLNSHPGAPAFYSHGETSLKGISIRGNLNCEGATLHHPDFQVREAQALALVANQAEVRGNVYLTKGRSAGAFRAWGQVLMLEAQVFGDLVCDGAELVRTGGNNHAISLDRSNIRGNATFTGIRARGQVRLIGTRVEGDLDFDSAAVTVQPWNVYAPLDLQRARINGEVVLKKVLARSVYLASAEIGCGLHCQGVRIVSTAQGEVGINATGAKIGGRLELQDLSAALFHWIKVAPPRHGIFTTPPFQGEKLPLKKVACALINLEGARAAHVILPWAQDPARRWESGARCRFLQTGFVYGAVTGCENKTDTYRWLRHQLEFAPQPYDQLASVVCRQGREDLARDILESKGDKQREEWQALIRTGRTEPGPGKKPEGKASERVPWPKRVKGGVKHGALMLRMLLHYSYKVVAGYGYKPGRALQIALVLFVAGIVIFWYGESRNWIVPNEPGAYLMRDKLNMPPPNYVKFNPVLYTFDVFVPALDLGQKKNWHPVGYRAEQQDLPQAKGAVDRIGGWLVAVYYPIAVVMGWILIAVGFLGPMGVIRKSIPSAP